MVSFEELDYINFAEIKNDAHWGFSVVDVKTKSKSFYDSIENMGRENYNGHCVCEDVKKFLRSTNYIRNIPACEWQLQYSETPQQTD